MQEKQRITGLKVLIQPFLVTGHNETTQFYGTVFTKNNKKNYTMFIANILLCISIFRLNLIILNAQ